VIESFDVDIAFSMVYPVPQAVTVIEEDRAAVITFVPKGYTSARMHLKISWRGFQLLVFRLG
jgi:hypothetical protein